MRLSKNLVSLESVDRYIRDCASFPNRFFYIDNENTLHLISMKSIGYELIIFEAQLPKPKGDDLLSDKLHDNHFIEVDQIEE